jgi:hypothetical protein
MGGEYLEALEGKSALEGLEDYGDCSSCGKSLPADTPHSDLPPEDYLRWMPATTEWWSVYEALESENIRVNLPEQRP